MALSEEQITWLGKLGLAQSGAEADLANRGKRAEALAEVQNALDGKRDEIRKALQGIKVELKPETFTQTVKAYLGHAETMALLHPDSDAMQEIDSFSDFARQKIEPKDAALATNVIGPIMEEYRKLLAKTDAEGNPLYSRDEPDALRRDFWEPLVREGIIPENFVPQEFSEVVQTFSSASDIYDERLKDYSKGLTRADKVLEYFDVPVAVGADILNIAASGLMMDAAIKAYGAGVTDLKANAPSKELKAKADIVSGVAACLTASKKAAEAVFKKRDFQGGSDALIGAMGKILTATIGKEQALFITGIATAASHAVPIGDAVVRGDMAAVIKQIGAGVGDSLSASSKDPTFKMVGEIVKAQFEVMAKAVEAAKDSTKAATIMLQAAISAGATAGKLINEKFKERALEDIGKDDTLSKTEREKKKTELTNFFDANDAVDKVIGGKDVIGAVELPEALKAFNDKASKAFDKQMVADLKEKAVRAQEAELNQMLTKPDAEFQQMLTFGFVQDEDDPESKGITEEMRLKSMESLIAEMQRQQKIYDLAKAIATGGIGAVEKFVPGLSAASAGTKTIFAFVEALQKGRQMLDWFRNQADAKVAVTVQYEVMMNRYGLAAEQAVVAGIQALTAAIDTVGKAMQMAGALAPVGVAISASATITENTMDIMMKVTTAAKMRSAWAVYQKALANPQDRKAARQALRDNPTLAKYALAWGALTDDNRIAQQALLTCGIDDKTLATPGTNVANVVKYLEAYFKDDPKLLREVPVPASWYPGEIELTATGWLNFMDAAEDKATPKFSAKGSDVVAARLKDLDDSVQSLADLGDRDRPLRIEIATNAVEEARQLVGALVRYAPVDKDKKPHLTVQTYVDAMLEKAKTRLEALTKGLETAKAEPELV